MNRAEALPWKERWRLVREKEIEERLRQLDTMLLLARQLGWTEALPGEDEEVRERWMRLRRLCGSIPSARS